MADRGGTSAVGRLHGQPGTGGDGDARLHVSRADQAGMGHARGGRSKMRRTMGSKKDSGAQS
jgi:hypothetical protein